MLGKTHITTTLLIGHVSIVGYTLLFDSKNKPMLFDKMIQPLNFFEYLIWIMTAVLMSLLLLRIGKRKMLFIYAALLLILGLVLYFDFGFIHQAYAFMYYLLAICFIFGALCPDIDEDTSTIGRYFKPLSTWIPHRTFTHTIWVIIGLSVAVWYFQNIYILVFTLGYFIHILEDSLSTQGIAWSYPIGGYQQYGKAVVKKGRKAGIFSYRTGGEVEEKIRYITFGFNVVLFLWMMYFYLK